MAEPVHIVPVPATPAQAEQISLMTEGQRKVNMMWEHTQSKIAPFVVIFGTLVNAFVIFVLAIFHRELSVELIALVSMCLQFINVTVGIVIGFYFGRTNHTAIGGTGDKPQQKYEGR